MYYATIIPVLILSFYMVIYLSSLSKHDKVLYKICQVRRDAMDFLRNDWDSMSKEDYISTRKLIGSLNITINNYNTHKTVLFNLRKFVAYVKEYESFSKEVEKIEPPKNEKIRELHKSAFIAFLHGFFSYTPLIKSELAMRGFVLLLSISAKLGIKQINASTRQIQETINSARERADQLGVC